jgi:hypothetical protein
MATVESESKELIDAGEIEKRLSNYRKIMGAEKSDFVKAIRTGQAMVIARKWVEQNAKHLEALQGTDLGFLSDRKDGERYSAPELVDFFTHALVPSIARHPYGHSKTPGLFLAGLPSVWRFARPTFSQSPLPGLCGSLSQSPISRLP